MEGQEHHNLKLEQVTRIPAECYDMETYCQYVENDYRGDSPKEYDSSSACSARILKVPCSHFRLVSQ